MKKLAITTSALAMLLSSAAFADMHDDDADAGEGPWTMEEFMMEFPEVTPEEFEQIDQDGTGMITEEELEAAIEAGIVEDPEPM